MRQLSWLAWSTVYILLVNAPSAVLLLLVQRLGLHPWQNALAAVASLVLVCLLEVLTFGDCRAIWQQLVEDAEEAP